MDEDEWLHKATQHAIANRDAWREGQEDKDVIKTFSLPDDDGKTHYFTAVIVGQVMRVRRSNPPPETPEENAKRRLASRRR